MWTTAPLTLAPTTYLTTFRPADTRPCGEGSVHSKNDLRATAQCPPPLFWDPFTYQSVETRRPWVINFIVRGGSRGSRPGPSGRGCGQLASDNPVLGNPAKEIRNVPRRRTIRTPQGPACGVRTLRTPLDPGKRHRAKEPSKNDDHHHGGHRLCPG